MIDTDRFITLDDLVESVPEVLVREAEQKMSSAQSAVEEVNYSIKDPLSMSKELSKAQRIRLFMDSNPEARNRDVVEALQQPADVLFQGEDIRQIDPHVLAHVAVWPALSVERHLCHCYAGPTMPPCPPPTPTRMNKTSAHGELATAAAADKKRRHECTGGPRVLYTLV